jgi:hypothetical protein
VLEDRGEKPRGTGRGQIFVGEVLLLAAVMLAASSVYQIIWLQTAVLS